MIHVMGMFTERVALMSTQSLLLLMLVAGLQMSGCANADRRAELNGEVFKITRLAISRDEQMRGLMFVENMPGDEGMLFVFNSSAPRSFWMKNTRIPLDIFYFDESLSLVSVSENARPCISAPCPSYPSAAAAQYVLELNAGTAARLGTRKGDVLTLYFDPFQ